MPEPASNPGRAHLNIENSKSIIENPAKQKCHPKAAL